MSEGGEGQKTQIEQEALKKEGVKPQETSGIPEKKLPLSKKISAAIKYISASVSEGKSRAADDEFTYISQEGEKPKTFKEHVEKEAEPKEFRFQLSGSKIPVEMLRAKELPEEMTLNVVLTGGAQAGVENANAVIKMMEMGLFDKKNLKINFWGISAGAANAAYAATGVEKAKEAVKMYTEENLGYAVDKDGKRTDTGGKLVYLPDKKTDQIKALFEASLGKPLVDTEYVADNVASGKRKLDVEALKASKYGVFVRLMNEEGGQEWVDLKQEKDPANTLRAAINVPGVSRKSFIERDGKKYADGAFAEGPLLEEIFKTQGDDAKVLIISNGSFDKGGQMEIVQKILGRKAKRGGEDAYGYNEKVAKLIATHNNEAKIQGKEVWDRIVEGKNITIMELTADSDFVPELEKDPEKLLKAGEKFAEFTGNIFDLGKELPLKPQEQRSAGEELKAMDSSGKPETGPDGVVKPVGEVSSGNANTEAAKVEEDKGEKPEKLKIEEAIIISQQYEKAMHKFLDSQIGGDAWGKFHKMDFPVEVKLQKINDINNQLDKFLPKEFPRFLSVPSEMIEIDPDGNMRYNPFNKPKWFESILGNRISFDKDTFAIGFTPIYKDKSVIAKLQDAYKKVKAAEEKEPA